VVTSNNTRQWRRTASSLGEVAVLLAASVLAAAVMWTIDLASWPSVRRPTLLALSLGLAVAVGTAMGIGMLLPLAPLRLLARARTRWQHGSCLLVATGVTLLAARQAMRSLPWSQSRAVLLVGASAVTVALLTWGLVRITREPPGARLCLPLAALAGALLVLDRTVLSSVFEKSYSFVEGLAHLATTLVWVGVIRAKPRRMVVLAVAGSVWLTIFVASRPLRIAIERSLPAVWEEPLFAARWLRRIRLLDTARAVEARTHLERLREKYALYHEPSGDDPWSLPTDDSTPPTNVSSRPSNVLVFFVDTLRADVAHDPSVMPDTVEWLRENQWFSRAYSSGSSTVLTLAPMLGCRYDTTPTQELRFFEAARSAGMKTALFIPKTASDYHRGAFPSFRFDHEEVLTDFETERRPTAGEVVDRALAWLREERPDRFLLWAYQFDAHGWSDLEETYVEHHAAEAGFSKSEGIHWRYRAAARGIDRSFTRLRAGLEELGLFDTTTVVFVSDHGEALGQQNFWAHSTYLWESLVRVPFGLHVPGKQRRSFDEPVSTVDLAPTLARLMGAPIASARCHGQDLLATDDVASRRLPILFSAMIDGEVARVGMLDKPDRKLVVDLRNADARLLRIQDGTSLEEDVSFAEPGDFGLRLRQIVRAPTFPR
jgi:hypothetical protein